MDTDMLRDESTAPADIPGLVAQARTAYQQNRIKECLALTKAALLVDPGNSAALEMQSAVRFDMQRDLSDARALIEESRNKPEAQKYRKAAEIILLKALYLDPDSEGAKTLLSTIRLASDSSTSPTISVPEAPVSYAPPIVSAPPTPAKLIKNLLYRKRRLHLRRPSILIRRFPMSHRPCLPNPPCMRKRRRTPHPLRVKTQLCLPT
jgi:tetratricopeptide (TPR) repeat protein